MAEVDVGEASVPTRPDTSGEDEAEPDEASKPRPAGPPFQPEDDADLSIDHTGSTRMNESRPGGDAGAGNDPAESDLEGALLVFDGTPFPSEESWTESADLGLPPGFFDNQTPASAVGVTDETPMPSGPPARDDLEPVLDGHLFEEDEAPATADEASSPPALIVPQRLFEALARDTEEEGSAPIAIGEGVLDPLLPAATLDPTTEEQAELHQSAPVTSSSGQKPVARKVLTGLRFAGAPGPPQEQRGMRVAVVGVAASVLLGVVLAVRPDPDSPRQVETAVPRTTVTTIGSPNPPAPPSFPAAEPPATSSPETPPPGGEPGQPPAGYTASPSGASGPAGPLAAGASAAGSPGTAGAPRGATAAPSDPAPPQGSQRAGGAPAPGGAPEPVPDPDPEPPSPAPRERRSDTAAASTPPPTQPPPTQPPPTQPPPTTPTSVDSAPTVTAPPPTAAPRPTNPPAASVPMPTKPCFDGSPPRPVPC